MLVPGRDDAFRRDFVEAYRRHWFGHEGSRLFAGTREVLDTLREQNFLLGVATGKARHGLIRVLEQWRDIRPEAPIQPWDFAYRAGRANRALSRAIPAK